MSSDLSGMRPPIPVLLVPALLVALFLVVLPATAEVEIFRLDERDGALEGEADSVAVGPLGELRLAPEVERIVGLDEPFVFTAASLDGGPFGSGWILGTGNDGKIVHVATDGTAKVLARAGEPTIFAVLGTAAGEVLAAGSPKGTVSRVVERDGEAEGEHSLEPILDPDATYVWALAEDADGRLLVATGLPGRLLRFDRGSEEVETPSVEVLWESPDDHVRSLLVHSDGSLWIGTAGQGRIVRLAVDGPEGARARTIYDASHPEVLSFAEGADGAVYAALLASEASFVDLAAEEGEESVTPSGEVAAGTRTAGFEGSRSAVMRFDADGRQEEVASLESETIHSLLWDAGDLWIGTGQEGSLYRLRDDVLVREAELDDRQIVGLARTGEAAGGEIGIATTNGAAVHRLAPRPAAEGTYASAVLDAGARARFGVFRWQGQTRGGRVDVAVRSGSSAEPDPTWSAWRTVARDLAPGEDGEIASGDAAAGVARYVQWRATLHRGDEGDGPRLVVAELSYRQENRAPEITAFEAMAPGAILVEQSFNPTSTVFEPWSPNRQGIFTTIDSDRQGEGNRKELWKQGWRTLRWEAKDANEDELLYALSFRRESDADTDEDTDSDAWLSMAEDLGQSYYSFDARVLPDGVYRFRLEATDAASRTDDEAVRVRRVSEPVTVDHTPPRLVSRSATAGGVEVRLEDAASPIRSASLSLDAGEWKDLRPADGLLDGHRETLRLEVPPDAGLALLRVMDASFNVVTFDLSRDRDER